MRPIEDVRADLAQVDGSISDAYWRFTRTSSPRVGPPDGNLYIRRNELSAELRAAMKETSP